MATRIVCPYCSSDFNVSDTMIGKRVRCKDCEEAFTAEELEDTGKARSARSDKIATTRKKSAAVDDDEDRPRRRRDDDDDDDEDERPSRKSRSDRKKKAGGAPVGLFIGIGVAALLLLLLGVAGLVWFVSSIGEDPEIAEIRRTQGNEAAEMAKVFKQMAKEMGKNPGQMPDMGKMIDLANDPGKLPFPGPGNNPFAGGKAVTSNAEALTLLRGADNEGKNRAIHYLSKTEPNGPEQAEIARQLATIQGTPGVFGADNALAKWATTQQVPALIKMIETTPFGPGNERRQTALRTLGKLQDERGIDIILTRMSDHWDRDAARQALGQFGDRSKAVLLLQAFHKNGEGRKEVQAVLQKLNASPEEMIPQAVTALGSPDNDVRQAALEYLARTPVVASQQPQVARALEGLLTDQMKRGEAVKALRNWATKDNVPALLTLWNQPGAPHAELRQVFVNLKDERGAEVVAKQLTDFFQREAALAALKQMGPEVASKSVVAYVTSPDRWISDRAKQLLEEWGSKNDDFLGQALKDLQTQDQAKCQAALDLLIRSQPQDAMRTKVLGAIQPLLTSQDGGTLDRATRAYLQWAGKESIQTLVQLATNEQSRYRHPAMDALAKFPDVPVAMQAIASRVQSFQDRGHARKLLEQIGAPAEQGVLLVLSSAKDKGAMVECCNILMKIGTKQSGPTLQRLALFAQAQKDNNLRSHALQTLQVCNTR